MPNDIVVGSTFVSLYDISQRYKVSMSELYALNPQFQRGTTNGRFSEALERQKMAAGKNGRDGDFVPEGEVIHLPDHAAEGPFYFYKSQISTYQREAALKRAVKADKADPDGLSIDEFVGVASKTKGVSGREAEDLFHELAVATTHSASGPEKIASAEVTTGFKEAKKAADKERAKEAEIAARKKAEAARAQAQRDEAAVAAGEPPREINAAEGKGAWASTYDWLGDKKIIAGTNGLNRVTFYAAWATPKAQAHPIIQGLGKKVSPRTGAVAYGLAQFFQGFKPGSDPLYTGAKVAEMGVATGLYFGNVVGTLSRQNDPAKFTLMEKWLNGQLKGQALADFVSDVNAAMAKDPKAAESLSFIQKLIYGAQKPGNTFAHDVVVKGFTTAMALDIANIAQKHGNLLLRAVDSDPKNDPTAGEFGAAGKDVGMSLGKHAPLLYTTMKGRAAIKGGFSQQAMLLEKAKGEAARAKYFDDLAKRASASGDQALAKQFELSKAHFQTLEKQTGELAGKVVADARVLSTKWMRGGFAMMDAAFALKNEADLVKTRGEVSQLETHLKTLSADAPERAELAQVIKQKKFLIKSFEDSRLSNAVNVAAHVTPAAVYKDVLDLVVAVGMPSMERYQQARANMGLETFDENDPLAGMFTATSPSIYFTQKIVERLASEVGHESPEDLLFQKRARESFDALISAFADHTTDLAKEMAHYFRPVLLPPIMPMPIFRF